MTALSNAASIYPRMLRDPHASALVWSPEAEATMKKTDEPQDSDNDSNNNHNSSLLQLQQQHVALAQATTSASSLASNNNNNNSHHDTAQALHTDTVPVRVARSQSLTDPKTPPMFASPTNSSTSSPLFSGTDAMSSNHNTSSTSSSGAPTTVPTLNQAPLSEPESIRATSSPSSLAPAVVDALGALQLQSQPQPLYVAPDPRLARRNRRSMSAEFTLSMLQQELGYPTRKSSRSRRDSVERKSRRTSSILEVDEAEGDDTAPSSTLSPSRSGTRQRNNSTPGGRALAEPEPECRSLRASIESGPKRHRSSVDDAQPLSNYDTTASTDNHSECASDDDDDEDENFLDSRVASVTGFSQDTDGVVYYEIIVRSIAHGPLSAYKVRRRYSEFRALHRALSAIMPVAHRSAPLMSEGVLPPADLSASAGAGLDLHERSSTSTMSLGPVSESVCLPPLPDRGGLWAYLQFDTTPFLERRAAYFEALLVACQRHPRARASRLLNDFLGPPPDAVALHTSVENSYVSLNRFAAPKLQLAVEAHERKQKARNISRRRSSVHRGGASELGT